MWLKSFWSAGKERKGTQVLKGQIVAQQEELSETTHAVTVFPVLCFLCPAAVPLLSMSQISDDRRVCAGCKEGVFMTVAPESEVEDDGRALGNAASFIQAMNV